MFKPTMIFWLVLAGIFVGQNAISIFVAGEVPSGFTANQLFLSTLPFNLVFVTLGAIGFLAGAAISRAVPPTRFVVVSGIVVAVLVMVAARLALSAELGYVLPNYIGLGVLVCGSFVTPFFGRGTGTVRTEQT